MAIIQRPTAALAASEQEAELLPAEPEDTPTGDGRDSDDSPVAEQLSLFD